MRVLVVDDHALVADALRSVLEARDDIGEVVAVIDPASAVGEARRMQPDVVLVDYRLGARDGIEVGAAIRAVAPEARLILLSGGAAPRVVGDAIEAGFAGYLEKTCSVDRLVSAMHSVMGGNLALDVGAVARLLRQPDHPVLSPREREVLDLVAQGLSTKEIAARAFISVNTARKHVQSILTALDAHSKLEAVVRARRLGLLA